MKLTISTIQLSSLRSPTTKHRVACPLIDDIKASYWRDLTIECYTKLANFGWFNTIASKRLRKWAFVGLTWAAFLPSFIPTTGRVVYADPIITAPTFKVIKPLPLLEEPLIKAQDVLETVYENKIRPYGTYGGGDYQPGQCTFGIASRLPIPNSWGNATAWSSSAAAAGYTVSAVPQAGAVAVSHSDSFWGHVALIEAVNPDGSFLIWEMNYGGAWAQDERIATTAEFTDFIYI